MISSIWLTSPHPVNCSEVSSSRQRSEIPALVSSHAAGILNKRQVLHSNSLQTCIPWSLSVLLSFFRSVPHTSLSKVQAATPCLFYTSLSPSLSLSSLPSPHHHLKEQCTHLLCFFTSLFHLFSYTFLYIQHQSTLCDYLLKF